MIQKREYDRDAKISKIIKKTLEIIKKNGYSHLTLRKIADTAGIAIGTVYMYFPEGIPAILREIINRNAKLIIPETQMIDEKDFDRTKMLSSILTSYIKNHRDNIEIIQAVEVEELKNINMFEGSEYLFNMDLEPFIKMAIKFGLNMSNNTKNQTKEKFQKIIKIIDSIVHKQILTGKIFENDEEMVLYLSDIINSLLLSSNKDTISKEAK